MRTCEENELLISAFIDGALDEADRAELMKHMAGCPVCQAYFDGQIAIHDALTALEEVPAPAEFSGRVMARVRETPQDPPAEKKTVHFPRWRQWTALAACCALALLGLWRFQTRGDIPAPRAVDSAAAGESADVLPAPSGRPAEPAEYDFAPAEAEIAPQMDLPSPASLEPAPGALPAGKAMEDSAESALGDGIIEREQSYAGMISTASPVAGMWVEENMGVAWEPGSIYELAEAEYAALREALLAGDEDFSEALGEAGGYLLLAE